MFIIAEGVLKISNKLKDVTNTVFPLISAPGAY